MMLSAGRENLNNPPQGTEEKVAGQTPPGGMAMAAERLAWPALLQEARPDRSGLPRPDRIGDQRRGVDRQLRGESPLVGGPRFAARDIGGEVGIFVEQARRPQPQQHRHHHQVAGAERAVQPVGVAQARGSCPSRSRMRSSTSGRRSAAQGLSPSRSLAVVQLQDRRLDRVERGEHPGDRARPGVGVVRQQARHGAAAICSTIAPVSNSARSPSS